MKIDTNEKRISRIAGRMIRTAAENIFADAFELNERQTEEFSENIDGSISTQYLEFSIDYTAVLEAVQDWQGNLSANRYDKCFREYLPDIISEKLLSEYDGTLPEFSYKHYDLFDDRVYMTGFSFNKLDDKQRSDIKSILDNIGLMK